MRIKKIRLKNFRNYEDQTIEVASGTNVFVGNNAQGKTNILEAIYLCSTARSHRTGKDIELIQEGKDFYQVEIVYDGEEIKDQSIEISYNTKSRPQRSIKYCGLKQNKISDFFGLFHSVIFAPEDLMLIKEGPAYRRRFLDVLISQIQPLYFKNLQYYQQYLKQRNFLLKTLKEMQNEKKLKKQSFNQELYDVNLVQLVIWTEKMTEIAASIIKTRAQYIERINELGQASLLKISSGNEKLELRYKTVSGINPGEEISAITEKLDQRYAVQQNDDIFKGNTGSGTHRDDLEIYIDGNLVKERGSQGQQRSAVLALKLAELSILEEETGEKPVLLLDDVMSELDETRREQLLSAFEENQAFITCTDLSQINTRFKGRLMAKKNETKASESSSYINFFKVEKGTVKAQILL